MAASQIINADGMSTLLPDTPQGGDYTYRLAENAPVPISTVLTIISLDGSSSDLAEITLCSPNDEFSASTDPKKPAVACADSAGIKLCLPDSRAWAFGIGTHAIGLDANSFGPALFPRIKPFVGEGELALIGSQFLSDAAASGRSMSALLDRQEQLAR
ncbi:MULTISPECIES: hypothetical protein [unclassified Mesorhizobium]|uniref:hypothetical protein n=1 Tax=unclassified Mesorhizobium TaxID=325217 RepID=UPI0012DE1B78|nr:MULTISPECIES: hypothetical protein [unclassified Mesorhizobium]